MNDHFRQAVREIVQLLAEGRYAEVESLTNGIRLKADNISEAIHDYGRQLVLPPDPSSTV